MHVHFTTIKFTYPILSGGKYLLSLYRTRQQHKIIAISTTITSISPAAMPATIAMGKSVLSSSVASVVGSCNVPISKKRHYKIMHIDLVEKKK